ncbi:unnamed protein product [Calicophoron daubneyi]|uniref:Tubulin--tyrosine ligase-like protein 12 SET-like domain-containing protein n=1 Tax=Calicophoron daubneyi TaxID=300641 RepID=A0AAV2T5R6_CALDB
MSSASLRRRSSLQNAVNEEYSISFKEFLESHEQQLNACEIPRHFWNTLFQKLQDQVYDADDAIRYYRTDERNENDPGHRKRRVSVKLRHLSCTNDHNIYLMQRAMIPPPRSMRDHLHESVSLKILLAKFTDTEINADDDKKLLDSVCERMWRFYRYYKMASRMILPFVQRNSDIHTLHWYILDELGSHIQHSDEPSFRMAPFFFYGKHTTCYIVLWPLRDLSYDDEVTVDYARHIKKSELRSYHLLPWQTKDFSGESSDHTHVLKKEFFKSHLSWETPPLPRTTADILESPSTLSVYTNVAVIREYLVDPRFKLGDSKKNAQVQWISNHFEDYENLTVRFASKFINHFPGEEVLTKPELLAALASLQASEKNSDSSSEQSQKCEDTHLTSNWYPVTFNLVHELPQFVAYFQRKQKRLHDSDQLLGYVTGMLCSSTCPRQQLYDDYSTPAESAEVGQNVWLLKPCKFPCVYGTCISNNINQILRICELDSLIARQYSVDPVLLYRDDLDITVKFEIRYAVLLRSVNPLTLYAYNVFWPRIANEQFSINDLDDHSKHFVDSHPFAEDKSKQLGCEEFIQKFNQQYPNTSWSNVQESVFKTLADLFTSATRLPSPQGITHCLQSRALYSVDLMLEWQEDVSHETGGRSAFCHQVHPLVCKVRAAPDFAGICEQHPLFYDHVFGCLFFDDSAEKCNVTKIA